MTIGFNAIVGPNDTGGSGGRTILTAATTYYVRTDGSDSNTGLVNSAGGAFLTIAKALNTVAALDCGIYVPTVSVQAGTYTAAVLLPKILGSATPILAGVGNTTIISTTSANAIENDAGGVWQINDLKVTVATAGNGLTVRNGGIVNFSNIEFGACPSYQAIAYSGSAITATGNFSISGGAAAAFAALSNGLVTLIGRTVTYSNSPVYSGANFYSAAGYLDVYSMTFTNGGTVTGVRYTVILNGVIFTNGGGASYVPGNSAGLPATGGQYA